MPSANGSTDAMNGPTLNPNSATRHPRHSSICRMCGAWLGQLGMEPTPDLYLEHMVQVFREVRRVLRPDGTLWMNMGDGYAAAGHGWGGGSFSERSNHGEKCGGYKSRKPPACWNLKKKDLIGMPWRLALALQADGWYLRQDIIWHKPAPMPSSCKDRPTTAHEYIFLLSKKERYYYDFVAIMEPVTGNAHPRGRGVNPKAENIPSGWQTGPGSHRGLIGRYPRPKQNESFSAAVTELVSHRNKRSVWTIQSRGFKGAHYATFSPELIEPAILAGTSAGGCCRGCGKPYKRLLGPAQPAAGRPSRNKERKQRENFGGLEGDHRHQAFGVPWEPNFRPTLGWAPTCGCDAAGPPVPCIILDPFAGSNTTGMVAEKFGRRWIACDMGYQDLQEKRTTNVQKELQIT